PAGWSGSAAGTAEARLAEQLQKRLDDAWIVDAAVAAALDLVQRGVARQRVAVGAPGGQRVVRVGDDDDARTQRDGVTAQLLGVTGAVEQLVAGADDRQHALALIAHGPEQ